MARAAETRFTRSGDVDIAYQVFGDGERDIVMTMGLVTPLEVMWELPELAYFLERLAGIGRVIIFDKRGTGLSDRVAGMVTLEQRAEDVGAVMVAAQSEQAAFVGWGRWRDRGHVRGDETGAHLGTGAIGDGVHHDARGRHRRPGPDAAPVGHDRAGMGQRQHAGPRGAAARR